MRSFFSVCLPQGELFRIVSEQAQSVTVADDNNDIYILSGEQHLDQHSPPSSLLCLGDNSSEQSSWQTESLPVSLVGHESWAQVSAMDPEDIKSLDSNEGMALAEERSENNSSNSDIVHVEREEAELLEEGAEGGGIEESMMSVIGTESELAELREEFPDQTVVETAPALLISMDESLVAETPEILSAEHFLKSSEPELPPPPSEDAATPMETEPEAPLPVAAEQPKPEPEPEPEVVAEPLPAEVTSPPLAAETPEAPTVPLDAPEEPPEPQQESELPAVPKPETVEEPAVVSVAAPVSSEHAEVSPADPAKKPPELSDSPSVFLAMLYGSAALVVLAAVVTYSVLRYRRK